MKKMIFDTSFTSESSKCKFNRPKLGNVVIIGDSYSTYAGYIPEGYAAWYYNNPEEGRTDVADVKETWWYQLMATTDSELVYNCACSGSTISHTGYEGADYSDHSFVTRARNLANDGFFKENTIDTLFIYGGLNDTWAGSPLGEVKYGDITEDELYSTLPAMSLMLATLKEATPKTKIIVIIDEKLSDGMKAGFKALGEHYGTEIIEPENISLDNGHPNRAGMTELCRQIFDAVK